MGYYPKMFRTPKLVVDVTAVLIPTGLLGYGLYSRDAKTFFSLFLGCCLKVESLLLVSAGFVQVCGMLWGKRIQETEVVDNKEKKMVGTEDHIQQMFNKERWTGEGIGKKGLLSGPRSFQLFSREFLYVFASSFAGC